MNNNVDEGNKFLNNMKYINISANNQEPNKLNTITNNDEKTYVKDNKIIINNNIITFN